MAEREVRTDVVLLHRRDGGAGSNLARRIRFDEATVERDVAAIRRWFSDREVSEFRCLVGPSATPRGVANLLLERGALPDEDEPELTAMVLDREPPAVTGVTVRAVTTFSDYLRMEEIREAVFGSRDIDDEERRARWSQFERAGALAYLALAGGTPVSFGVMNRTEAGPMLPAGGVTLPEHRGRGLYRALVRACWDAAQRSGAPALVTQAQAASRPILERLGFRSTGVIQVLVDRRPGGGSALSRPAQAEGLTAVANPRRIPAHPCGAPGTPPESKIARISAARLPERSKWRVAESSPFPTKMSSVQSCPWRWNAGESLWCSHCACVKAT
jgi:GNAT superfamily N-acetyltransferase